MTVDSEFVAVFRAKPGTRRSKVASVPIYSFLLFLTLAVGGWLLLVLQWDIDIRDRPRFLWLILGVPLVISGGLAWCWGHRRFVFFVGLDETHLQVGEDPGKRIGYEELELVTLAVRPAEALFGGVTDSVIEFRGKGFRARACIEPADRYECAGLLSERCPDALFVDERGRECLSARVADPRKVMGRAATYNRRCGWGNVSTAVGCALMAAVMLYAHSRGTELGALGWLTIICCGLGLVGGLLAAVHHFREARRLANVDK